MGDAPHDYAYALSWLHDVVKRLERFWLAQDLLSIEATNELHNIIAQANLLCRLMESNTPLYFCFVWLSCPIQNHDSLLRKCEPMKLTPKSANRSHTSWLRSTASSQENASGVGGGCGVFCFCFHSGHVFKQFRYTRAIYSMR